MKNKKGRVKGKGKNRSTDILGKINGDDALAILRTLAREDKELAEGIKKAAIGNYQALSFFESAKKYCMGILKGIYEFEKESTSEFKKWAVDVPEEFFKVVLDEWKRGCKEPKDIKEMEKFIHEINKYT